MHKLAKSSSHRLNSKLFVLPPAIRQFGKMAAKASVTDKNVAVIGGSRGIGLEFVRQLLNRGNTVHATARKPEAAQGLQDLKSDRLTITALDTSSTGAISEWAAALKGKKKFDTNAIGPLILVQQLLENGLLGSGSTVANMTSKMGSIADNGSGGSYAYRASKSALNQITKSLAIDLESQGITTVLLHPGWVRTDMTKHKGLIDVDECVSGLLNVLETEQPLNGRFFDYKHDEIPW